MERRLFLSGMLLMAPLWLPAQTPADTAAASPGARLRVTVDSGRPNRFIGVLVAQQADSLWIQRVSVSPTVPVPRSRVLRLEVSRGQRSYWRAGAALGSLLGTGVGYLTVQGKTYDLGDNTPTFQVLGSMAIGAIIGGVVGASIHRDRWQVLPWPRPPHTAP